MQAIDTNIIIRLLMNDDPKQSKLVYQLFQSCYENETQLFVSSVVILEVMWVLSSSFKMSNDKIIEALTDLRSMKVIHIEHSTALVDCLETAKGHKFDLSDLFIGSIAHHLDHQPTWTFDKLASRCEWFERLK